MSDGWWRGCPVAEGLTWDLLAARITVVAGGRILGSGARGREFGAIVTRGGYQQNSSRNCELDPQPRALRLKITPTQIFYLGANIPQIRFRPAPWPVASPSAATRWPKLGHLQKVSSRMDFDHQ